MSARLTLGVVLVCTLFVLLVGPLPCGAQVVELKDGVERLSIELAKSVPAGRTLRIVVTDFPDLQGITSNLGRYIAERLTTRLSAQTGKFRVIERRRLTHVLGELKFSMSDLVDPAKAKQLGRMLGAEAIAVGTVSDLGNSIDVDARIIEIETNDMLPGVAVAISKDETVRRMWDEGRVGVAGRAPPSSQPGTAPAARGQPQPTPVKMVETGTSRIELVSMEIGGNALRLNLRVTNLRDRAATFKFSGLNDINVTFMLDDLGSRRYKFVGGSEMTKNEVRLPPQIPVRQWVAFEVPEAQASRVHVFLTLWAGTWERVGFRDLPVPQ